MTADYKKYRSPKMTNRFREVLFALWLCMICAVAYSHNILQEYNGSTYDANGNMTSDKNKGITSITYNTINQPQKITFSDGKTTEYVYSYDGTKLQTKHTTPVPQTSTTTTYSGNLIYENGELKRLLVDGGYVTFNGTTPKYHFYIQDHLGNNRVVADEGGNIEQINHYYPYGGLMEDISTNSDAQPYKYNGKELDRMHGLDMYDYGARHYNAAIGRWPTMDALAEKTPETSPYVYCIDNPVNDIDLDGRISWKTLKGGIKIVKKVANNGIKELGKASTYADAFSDIVDNGKTIFDSDASLMDKVGTSLSITAEFLLPVGPSDIRDAKNLYNSTKGIHIDISSKNKIDRGLLNPPTKKGQAPTFKKDGSPVEIHHEGQNPNGSFQEMHKDEHRGKGHDKTNHPNKNKPSKIDRREFNKAKKEYWRKEYEQYFKE